MPGLPSLPISIGLIANILWSNGGMGNQKDFVLLFFNAFSRTPVVHNLKHETATSLMFIAESFAKKNPGL